MEAIPAKGLAHMQTDGRMGVLWPQIVFNHFDGSCPASVGALCFVLFVVIRTGWANAEFIFTIARAFM